MRADFVQVRENDFCLDGRPFRMRGFALGSWMNLEHFMIDMPGTHSMIRDALAEVYGPERAGLFLARLAEEMVGELSGPGGTYEGNAAYVPRGGYELDEFYHDNEVLRTRLSDLWFKVMSAN